jgi:molybdopterin molybdotransferase
MKFGRNAISVTEAQQKIEAFIIEGTAESVALYESFGRRLAEPIKADHPTPHFNRSGMDGYAVRSADTLHAAADSPVMLEVIETIPCGQVPAKELSRGQAARIMTGSVVPAGADAVIMFEMTETAVQGGTTFVSVKRSMRAGENITPIGSEIHKGALLLEKGQVVGAGEAAILAAYGHHHVQVFRQPIAAIIATGSELLPIAEPLQPGRIRNSNSALIASLVHEAGALPLVFDQQSDDLEAVQKTVLKAFDQADIVITSGGVSVGDYDILSDLFDHWEGSTLFNKVAMRPGSPTTVGVWQNKLLCSLSGNPGACFVGFELFARPMLWGMQGRKPIYHQQSSAFLASDFAKPAPYQRFVRARKLYKDGKVYVEPAGMDKSSIMVSIKDADCLIIIPPGGRGKYADDLVSILHLPTRQ